MVSLVLKRSFDGFEGVDTWFWKQKQRRKRGEHPLILQVRHLYAYPISFMLFLCLCCLRTRVRSLGTVCVGSQSFGVGFVLCLFCWILESLRKVLKKFKSLSQSDELVGKPNHPVH